jgi:hypothetical protein
MLTNARQPFLAAADLRFWREEVSTALLHEEAAGRDYDHFGRMPVSNFLAPMPLARDPSRRHIGAVEQIAVAVTDGAKRERSNVAILRRRLPPR